LALLLALLLGAAARAEAAPSRTKRDRPVAVTVNPAEPLPEIHVAPDTPTWLWFPAQILKKTISVDQSRIRVLDVGERSIIVQAVENYRPDEREDLEVFFADGKAPARSAFVLVMDPAEVDTRIDVQRPELPNAACPAGEPKSSPRAVTATHGCPSSVMKACQVWRSHSRMSGAAPGGPGRACATRCRNAKPSSGSRSPQPVCRPRIREWPGAMIAEPTVRP
jgi:hypothetical protein